MRLLAGGEWYKPAILTAQTQMWTEKQEERFGVTQVSIHRRLSTLEERFDMWIGHTNAHL
jgi:hypothetical protein